MQIFKLLFINNRRTFVHRRKSQIVLGERDDFVNAFFVTHQHDQAVKSRCDAAVGRGSELECLHEEAERLLRPLLRRQNVSWSVENYLQLARTGYLAGMQQEARAALEGALRADPSRVAPLLKQEPWKSLLQQPRP